jgi:hypothetical protein
LRVLGVQFGAVGVARHDVLREGEDLVDVVESVGVDVSNLLA